MAEDSKPRVDDSHHPHRALAGGTLQKGRVPRRLGTSRGSQGTRKTPEKKIFKIK